MTVDPEILEELEGWADDDEEDDDETTEADPVPVRGRSDRDGPTDGGSLVLVATPIGNLGDLSPRAAEVLAMADVIYCEDTRHSRKLLTHAGITGASLRSLHEHNEEERIDEVLRSLAEGRVVAVVTDAGMPGISDPGSRLVAAAA
ncbi:MAG TPA: SAM-dependent methyltransferase, partial [Acidimicrobiales bacterium]|nr:SAM-dependent methyltransferase [Acidimicrobiales bacterium]